MKAPLLPVSLFPALRLFWILDFGFWIGKRQQTSSVRTSQRAIVKPIGMSLVALLLGFAPAAHADSVEGAVNFNLPSDTSAASDSSTPAPHSAQPSRPAPEESAVPTPDSTTPADSAPAVDSPSSAPIAASTPSPSPSPVVSFALPEPFIPAPPPPSNPPPSSPPPASPSPSTPLPTASTTNLFTGGSDSLVARTVGHAEGTRTVDGSKTRAYQGHVDPGNGVWNLGSFSFQHCREYNCSTPEQADVHQLKRLQGQAEKLEQKTATLGIAMSLLEELNGIDLANQAPLAALGAPGYADWLKQARDKGLTDSEAVLWARVQSYWDPNRNGWNAPGLGNSEDRISHDQNRRLTAIARALDLYQQQVAAGKLPQAPKPKVASKPPEEKTADRIIFQNLQ